MGIARSTYYNTPRIEVDDTALAEVMAAICDEFEAYGWRRVRAALRQRRMVVNHIIAAPFGDSDVMSVSSGAVIRFPE